MAAVPQHHRTLLHASDVVRAAEVIRSVPAAAEQLAVCRNGPFTVAAASVLKARVLCGTKRRSSGWSDGRRASPATARAGRRRG